MAVVAIVSGVGLVLGAKRASEFAADHPYKRSTLWAFGGREGAVYFNRV